MSSLKDKVIVVTGGTGVLGGAFVDAIHEAGGSPVILGRKKEVAEARAKAINEAGGKALGVAADVLNDEDLIRAKDEIIAHFGRIDGLVNAAGGISPEGVLMPDQDIFKMNVEGMKKVMDLNLWGTRKPTQVFGEEIAKTGKGSIDNISSMN